MPKAKSKVVPKAKSKVNPLSTNEILTGLKHRLDTLNGGIEILKNNISSFMVADYESRIDELESIYNWIRENSQE